MQAPVSFSQIRSNNDNDNNCNNNGNIDDNSSINLPLECQRPASKYTGEKEKVRKMF